MGERIFDWVTDHLTAPVALVIGLPLVIVGLKNDNVLAWIVGCFFMGVFIGRVSA